MPKALNLIVYLYLYCIIKNTSVGKFPETWWWN